MTAVLAAGEPQPLLNGWTGELIAMVVDPPRLQELTLRSGYTFKVEFLASTIVLEYGETQFMLTASGPRFLASGALSASTQGSRTWFAEVPAELAAAVDAMIEQSSAAVIGV